MSFFSDVSAELKFLLTVGRLKKLKRTGWVMCNIESPESVSDHMYRMALTCFLLPRNESIDLSKCIKMALVHDLAESLVGDITPHCGVSKDEKHKKEAKAIREVAEMLNDQETATTIVDLFEEFEADVFTAMSPESIYVQDIDKFEMILSALEYETEQHRPLNSFFDSTEGFFKTELFKRLSQEVRSCRNTELQKIEG